MLVRQSAKIKIEQQVSPVIAETIKQYSLALQFCINTAWEYKIKNHIKLQKLIYYDIRKQFKLPAQLTISCLKQACGIIKDAKTKPIIKKASIRYNFPRVANLKNNILSLTTLEGRKKFIIQIPDCYKDYFTTNWKLNESLLRTDSKGKTFFYFCFCSDINTKNSNQHIRVLGIDVGVNRVAVSSFNKIYGKDVKNKRIQRDNLVSQLQAKGTRASKRKLKKLSGKFARFMSWKNHIISKDIVNDLREGDVVVMEDLEGIRESASYNVWVHKWAFRQLQSFIEYKSLKKGCRVVYANPYHTSKECPICHNIGYRNKGIFKCSHCGLTLNCDIIGARNLAQRYIRDFDVGHRSSKPTNIEMEKPIIVSLQRKFSSCS